MKYDLFKYFRLKQLLVNFILYSIMAYVLSLIGCYTVTDGALFPEVGLMYSILAALAVYIIFTCFILMPFFTIFMFFFILVRWMTSYRLTIILCTVSYVISIVILIVFLNRIDFLIIFLSIFVPLIISTPLYFRSNEYAMNSNNKSKDRVLSNSSHVVIRDNRAQKKLNIEYAFKGVTISFLIYIVGRAICQSVAGFLLLGEEIKINYLEFKLSFQSIFFLTWYVITIPLIIFLIMIAVIIKLRNIIFYRNTLIALSLITIALVFICLHYKSDTKTAVFFISNIIPLFLSSVYYLSIQEYCVKSNSSFEDNPPSIPESNEERLGSQRVDDKNSAEKESKKTLLYKMLMFIKSFWNFDK